MAIIVDDFRFGDDIDPACLALMSAFAGLLYHKSAAVSPKMWHIFLGLVFREIGEIWCFWGLLFLCIVVVVIPGFVRASYLFFNTFHVPLHHLLIIFGRLSHIDNHDILANCTANGLADGT